MKQAIFVGKQETVDYVYAADTICSLMDELYFPYGSRVFTQQEFATQDFGEISFLFSTWGMCELTETEIERYFPKLECVFYAAGSVQCFAKPFLQQGVKVISAWAANGIPVAEYTVAQIILASKGYFSHLHLPGSGGALRRADHVFSGNYDMTVGLVGAGMIGTLVIERIHRILEHVRILVFDPFLPPEKAEKLGVTLCDLPALFAQSDVISNHLANNPQTVGILDGKLFDAMKPYAVFINTGRGAQVVEEDLIKSLKEVPTRTALLDVTFPEPPSEGSPFYEMPNVFLTPHIAGSLGNEVRRMGEYMLEEYRLYAQNKPLRYEVTMDMLKTMA